MKIGALFAGIGGLDLGFEKIGHEVVFASEIDPIAQYVLKARMPNTKILGDIKEIKKIQKVDLLTGGFPCQDISLAGTRLGLLGKRSGLVNEVLRLVEVSKPEFVLLENVLNLLRLEKGAAMKSILTDFEKLGYRWAYRVVDSRGFGLPQRRFRVVILASRGTVLPGNILFPKNCTSEINDSINKLKLDHDYGFYWTEGKRGIGWATDAVPTIKGGSGLGIPSAPAIYSTKHKIAGTIHINDAERLQGFPDGWTDLPEIGRIGNRWRLVGNAVSAPVSDWISDAMTSPENVMDQLSSTPISGNPPLPFAAFNHGSGWAKVEVGPNVSVSKHVPLREFLIHPVQPLSQRALAGYIKRTREGNKSFPPGFISALEKQERKSTAGRLPDITL